MFPAPERGEEQTVPSSTSPSAAELRPRHGTGTARRFEAGTQECHQIQCVWGGGSSHSSILAVPRGAVGSPGPDGSPSTLTAAVCLAPCGSVLGRDTHDLFPSCPFSPGKGKSSSLSRPTGSVLWPPRSSCGSHRSPPTLQSILACSSLLRSPVSLSWPLTSQFAGAFLFRPFLPEREQSPSLSLSLSLPCPCPCAAARRLLRSAGSTRVSLAEVSRLQAPAGCEGEKAHLVLAHSLTADGPW